MLIYFHLFMFWTVENWLLLFGHMSDGCISKTTGTQSQLVSQVNQGFSPKTLFQLLWMGEAKMGWS